MAHDGRDRAGSRGSAVTALPRIRSAARSAIMIVGALVLPDGSVGITDASTTRRPSTPRTRSCGSTTDASSLPMRQVPIGWYTVSARARTKSTSSLSDRLVRAGWIGAPRYGSKAFCANRSSESLAHSTIIFRSKPSGSPR